MDPRITLTNVPRCHGGARRNEVLRTEQSEVAAFACTLETSAPKVMRAFSAVTFSDFFVASPVLIRRVCLAICARLIGSEWVSRPVFSAGFAHGARLIEVIPLRRMLLSVPSLTRPRRPHSSTFLVAVDLKSNGQGTVVKLALINTSKGPLKIAIFLLGGLVRMGWRIGCVAFFNAARLRLPPP